MAKFDFPDSDRKLLAFLNRTIATRNSDAQAGVVYVSQSVFNEVVAFAPVFEARLLKVAARLAERWVVVAKMRMGSKRMRETAKRWLCQNACDRDTGNMGYSLHRWAL